MSAGADSSSSPARVVQVIDSREASPRVTLPKAQHAGQQLTMVLSSKKKTELLDLPMELLELIAEHIDVHVGIFDMRLTCKTLSAAAFKTFTKEYIASLSCFILDPVRLVRIKNITSTPHLAERIGTLDLTCRAFEQRRASDMAIVPGRQKTVRQARLDFILASSEEETTKHQAVFTQQETINLELVDSILADLRAFNRCSIDLISDPIPINHLQNYTTTLATSCMELVRQHSLPLNFLALTDRCDLGSESFSSQLLSPTLARSLNGFVYHAWFEKLDDMTSTKAIEHFRVVSSIISSVRLENLEISLWASSPALEREQAYLELPTLLMSPAGMSTVKWLNLRHIRLYLSQMLDIITSCKGELTKLSLIDVGVLHHDHYQWKEIFGAMKGLTMLEEVELKELGIGRREVTAEWHEYFVVRRCEGEEFGIWSNRYGTSTAGYVDAKDFLRWNAGQEG